MPDDIPGLALSGPTVWVFNGASEGRPGRFPSGVFASVEDAEVWIAQHRLTGVLTEYPVGRGVYDLMVGEGHWTPKHDRQRTPGFIGTFSSAYLRHVHYEDGHRG
jgi:hypothetical protein